MTSPFSPDQPQRANLGDGTDIGGETGERALHTFGTADFAPGDEAFAPDGGSSSVGSPGGAATSAAAHVDPPQPVEANPVPIAARESSYVRRRAARRRWRRRLAALILAGFALAWLGFGATIYRDSFERQQEKRVKAAIGAEFTGVKVVADGRRISLEGSVASAADAKAAAELAKRVRYVKGVDTSKLQIGGSVGRILPLKAIYSEGKVSFEGTRPSEAALQALVTAAGKGLGDANVAAQFVEPTGSGGDVDAYAALGAAFARFPAINVRSATVDISDTEATVSGRVADDAGRSELVQTLSSATARTVIDNLQLEIADSSVPAASDTTTGTIEGTTEATDSTPDTASVSVADPTSTVVPGSTTLVESSVASSSTAVPSTTIALAVSTLDAATRATLQAEIDATLKANRIEFATDSSALGAQAQAIIADLAARLAPTGAVFEVGGHTDSRGRAERNLALSQRRADAVRAEFIRLGISADRVVATGYGSQFTIAPDTDPRGNPVNRRIEITLK
jgi:outer membrane protein OmpA-like peptidoglycan-associated protein/osmotically-inducible protein OsmY